MSASQEQLLQALSGVTDPNTGKDFVSTKALKNLQVSEGDVSFDVELGYTAKSQIPALRTALVAAATRKRPCSSLHAWGLATAFSMSLTVMSPTQRYRSSTTRSFSIRC